MIRSYGLLLCLLHLMACAGHPSSYSSALDASTTEVFVLPDERAIGRISQLIDNATQSIDLGIYILSDDLLIQALARASQRHITVRVVIDDSTQTHDINRYAWEMLLRAGVRMQAAQNFRYHHAKYAIFDRSTALVMTANWSKSSFSDNREVVLVVHDGSIANDLEHIFDADLIGGQANFTTPQLVVSPINSRSIISSFISQTRAQLYVAMEEFSDQAMAATLSTSRAEGVDVKVLMPDPSSVGGDSGLASQLVGAGIEVRFLSTPYLHEKAIISDGQVFVGSENMSTTSLDQNREIGLFLSGQVHDLVLNTFLSDWQNARPF